MEVIVEEPAVMGVAAMEVEGLTEAFEEEEAVNVEAVAAGN